MLECSDRQLHCDPPARAGPLFIAQLFLVKGLFVCDDAFPLPERPEPGPPWHTITSLVHEDPSDDDEVECGQCDFVDLQAWWSTFDAIGEVEVRYGLGLSVRAVLHLELETL